MSKAKLGDKVKVHYTGKFKDGTVFDSSKDRQPLEFKIGSGQLIQGFEQAVIDMEEGASKSEEIPFEAAYGPVKQELVHTIEKDKLPENIRDSDLKQGDQLMLNTDSGKLPVNVTEVTKEAITIDANHPLAGKDLIFEIELVEIEGKQKK